MAGVGETRNRRRERARAPPPLLCFYTRVNNNTRQLFDRLLQPTTHSAASAAAPSASLLAIEQERLLIGIYCVRARQSAPTDQPDRPQCTMMETVVAQHQRRPSGNSAFFAGGSSDSGGSSTSTSPSPPDHFGGGQGVFAAQQFSPTGVDSAYVSTTSSPSGAGRFSIWSSNAVVDAAAADDKAANARRQLFSECTLKYYFFIYRYDN